MRLLTNTTDFIRYEFIGLDSVLMVIVLLFLLVLIIALYLKVRVWILVFAIFGFNIIFCMNSFQYELPFAPYLQIFVMLFSGIIFLITSIEAFKGDVR